jgi:hypothetical protein
MNNELAVWIALISFGSSLIVVLINAAVTLGAKKIDALQKRDEHTLALQKLYLTRKLEVAESTIGRWTLEIRLLTFIYNDYNTLLQAIKNGTAGSEPEEEFNKKFDSIITLSEKVRELHFTEKDYYPVYFKGARLSYDDGSIEEDFRRATSDLQKVYLERNELAIKCNALFDGPERDIVYNEYELVNAEFENCLEEYLEATSALCALYDDYRTLVREELKVYSLLD